MHPVLTSGDCLLHELPSVLTEYVRPKCSSDLGGLAPGSVILFGSVGHLAQRGLSNYIEELGRTYSALKGIAGNQTAVIHLVPFLLSVITDQGLIRDLIDLDGWLGSGKTNNRLSLPKSRKFLWKIVNEQAKDFRSDDSGAGPRLFLPEGMQNPRKVVVDFASIVSGHLGQITPLTVEDEKRLASTMTTELYQSFGLPLGTQPVILHDCATLPTVESSARSLCCWQLPCTQNWQVP